MLIHSYIPPIYPPISPPPPLCVKGPERLLYLRGASSNDPSDGSNNNNNNNNNGSGGINSGTTGTGTGISPGPSAVAITHQEGYYSYPTTTGNERRDGYEICDMPFG